MNQLPPDDGVQRPELTIDQLTQMGAQASKNGLAEVARVAFFRALAIEPQRADLLANIANSMRYTWRFDEANHYIARALENAPMDGRVWGIYGAILMDQNRPEEAIDAFQKALQWGGGAPYTRFGLSEVLLAAGRFDEGLRGYEARHEIKGLDTYPYPLWRGEPLGNKILHVVAEQGLGDMILFSRFLPRIPGNYVVSVPPPLVDLFGPGTLRRGEAVRADYWLPMMSLPIHVGTDITLTPFLRPRRIVPLTNRGAFNIGIVWQSKAGGEGTPEELRHGMQKSCSLELFLELAEIDGVQLHSLQYNQDAYMMTMGLVNQLPQYDFHDQASYMQQLDLVVSVDTAPIHLVGALGRPGIVLLNCVGSWQWGTSNRTPWYPSLEIVRQTSPHDWRSAMAQAKNLVLEMMEKHNG